MLLTVEAVCCILRYLLALLESNELLSSLERKIIMFLGRGRSHISDQESV